MAVIVSNVFRFMLMHCLDINCNKDGDHNNNTYKIKG